MKSQISKCFLKKRFAINGDFLLVFLDISGADNLQLLTAFLEFSASFRSSFPRFFSRIFIRKHDFFIKTFRNTGFPDVSKWKVHLYKWKKTLYQIAMWCSKTGGQRDACQHGRMIWNAKRDLVGFDDE